LNPFDDLLDRVDFQYRQDRAEHLFLHDWRVRRDVDQHRRRDVAFVGSIWPPTAALPLASSFARTIEVPAIDHAPIVGTEFRIVAVEFPDR
jgi:hypothetical protein